MTTRKSKLRNPGKMIHFDHAIETGFFNPTVDFPL
jgi:hypothetical protein